MTGKVNFRNLSRYSSLNEKTFSRNFGKEDFPFLEINVEMAKNDYETNNPHALLMDCSFIKKSGKKTFGRGNF